MALSNDVPLYYSVRHTESAVSDKQHIIWPGIVIGLLLLSGVTTFGVLVASKSDGGAQVIDDYYKKSVAWDSLRIAQIESANLEWDAVISVETSEDGKNKGMLTRADKSGIPLGDFEGSVTVSRPQTATTFGTHRVAASDTEAGVYEFDFPYSEPGLWVLHLEGFRGNDRFVKQIRVEI
jgi:hypothetical protein